MYQATNSWNRSSVRASRPISVFGALADSLLVGLFSAATLALACRFIALNDVFDTFTDVFFIVRLAMLLLPVSLVSETAAHASAEHRRSTHQRLWRMRVLKWHIGQKLP
jgi:hypothetical protein